MKSIRKELTVRILTGTSAMLITAGIILSVTVHSRLIREFDSALEAKARALATLISFEGDRLEVDFDVEVMPEFGAQDNPEYFQIYFQDGSLIKKSDSLGESALPLKSPSSEDALFQDLQLSNGKHGRLAQITFFPRAEDDEGDEGKEKNEEDLFDIPSSLEPSSASVILTVARSREDLDALFLSLFFMLTVINILLLVGIGILVRLSIRKGLEPVDVINSQISAIGPTALEDRVYLRFPPKELKPIMRALNSLLERMQAAFEREHKFSSDVAHELRTPVSELRTACEVGGKWPEDKESAVRFFHDAHEIALQMERIVANLLTIARYESGKQTISSEAIQIASMIEGCWNRAAEGTKKTQRLNLQVDSRIIASTDREKLQRILQNLIDNAVSHSLPGSTINCVSKETDSGVEVIIENPANDLVREDLKHIFERFWRKDPARSGSIHSGLGLSIVKTLSKFLGINLSVDLKDDSTFQVRMSFPLSMLSS